jgi:flagellar hook protein FlgE
LPPTSFARRRSIRAPAKYRSDRRSGEFNLRSASAGGADLVSPSAPEAANVDLADEFAKMILTRRSCSANARVITTADEMLNTLIRIRR